MVFLERPADFNPKMRVSGCFVEVDGHILLVHRQPWKPDGDTWSVSAGKHEADETPLEALIREVKEETGIDISPFEIESIPLVFVRLAAFDIEYFVFHVQLPTRPEIVLEPDAHQAYQWTTPEEALKLRLIEDEDTCIKLAYGMT